MAQSDSIAALAGALAKTQGEMKAPPKTKAMKIPGRGDYKYADLADVIEARRVGHKHGLAITQGMEMDEGNLVLSTMLMHSSGEWKAWSCPVPLGLKPQDLGSYLTYMRRYSECGAWGIAAEDDDDGKGAHEATPSAEPPRQQTRPAQGGARPDCPACGSNSAVIASKFKEGEYVCYDKKGGCKTKFTPVDMILEDGAQLVVESSDVPF